LGHWGGQTGASSETHGRIPIRRFEKQPDKRVESQQISSHVDRSGFL
jgi:hypothetical protein